MNPWLAWSVVLCPLLLCAFIMGPALIRAAREAIAQWRAVLRPDEKKGPMDAREAKRSRT